MPEREWFMLLYKEATVKKKTPILTREDLKSHIPEGKPVVRLFVSPYHWYAGTFGLESEVTEDGKCWIYLNPCARFERDSNEGADAIDWRLISPADRLAEKMDTEKRHEFSLTDAHAITAGMPAGTVCIEGKEGVAVISVRAEDVLSVQGLFRHAEQPSLPQERPRAHLLTPIKFKTTR